MKNLLYPLVFATAFVATACTSTKETDFDTPVDPNGKTAISFVGQSNNRPITRAGFTKETQIVMHIRSNKNGGNTTDVRETRTIATAAIDNTHDDNSTSSVNQTSAYVRYWDDAYGRDAQLSIFAIAVPGKTYSDNTLENKLTAVSGEKTWDDAALSENIAWSVSADQSEASTISDEDLVYSNNIQGEKKLGFKLTDSSNPTGPGTFDKGNLEFTHALSRMTVHLKKGEGYSATGAFAFASGTNVKVLGVPTSGTLNIETGAWSTGATNSDITKMATTTKANDATYSLMAQMLPGYTFTDGSTTNVLEFIIDDNKYFVTQDMMLDALNKGQNTNVTSLTMEQHKNYVFTITVGKSNINVTAKLEKWVDVDAANQDMDNSHISLDLFTSNGTASTNFDLYRLNDASAEISTGASTAKNWEGDYTDKAGLTTNGTVWTTDWFFENNKAFYHFRTVNKGTEIKGTADNTVDDYFEIASGAQASHDYHWGAPFINTTTSSIKYSTTTGYTDYLSPAIGATNSTISMTELHMMSNISVVLRTTKTANAVSLEDASKNQCEVSLTYFYANGQVKMGNGLVSTTGSLTTSATFTAPTTGIDDSDVTYKKTGAFTFAVVPQALVRTTGDNLYVGITIKTPDNNQYYVVKKLSDIVATANGDSQNQTKDGKITFWYPNHSYTYTFTLTKAGIDDVTCTVQNWVNVTADNKDISLED